MKNMAASCRRSLRVLHCENITVCLKEALEQSHLKFEDMDAFAVTRGPGLIGCLHVGLQAAKTLAMLYDKPFIPVHHLAGHIYANQYAGEFKYPLLCVVVSGGNTQLVIMKHDLDFTIIGETKDDAVGECYDKVARVLGCLIPGGFRLIAPRSWASIPMIFRPRYRAITPMTSLIRVSRPASSTWSTPRR
jgi:glycoprotease/Kae1 family metallohydrolase